MYSHFITFARGGSAQYRMLGLTALWRRVAVLRPAVNVVQCRGYHPSTQRFFESSGGRARERGGHVTINGHTTMHNAGIYMSAWTRLLLLDQVYPTSSVVCIM